MKKPAIPLAIAERAMWLNNFAVKLLVHATKYGISTAETTDMTSSAAYFGWTTNYVNVAEPTIQKNRRFLRQLMDGVPTGATAHYARAFLFEPLMGGH